MEGVTTMFKKQLFPMHLQFFAEPEGKETPPAGEQTPELDLENLNDEQLAAIKEKFGFKNDDDVDSIIKSKHARWQKELEQEKNEAARLAKLNEKERQAEEAKKRQSELDEREKAIQLAELRIETKKQLSEDGLPETFTDMVLTEDADQIKANITEMRKAFDEAVEAEVNKRLVQKRPRVGSSNGGTITKESIMAIKDDEERARLISENRNLF